MSCESISRRNALKGSFTTAMSGVVPLAGCGGGHGENAEQLLATANLHATDGSRARAAAAQNTHDIKANTHAEPTLPSFASRAMARAATIMPGVQLIYLRGHTIEGVGGALYRRLIARPTGLGLHQFASNAGNVAWELVPEGGIIRSDQLGARTDDPAFDNTPALKALWEICGLLKCEGRLVPGNHYCLTPLVWDCGLNNMHGRLPNIRGCGRDCTSITFPSSVASPNLRLDNLTSYRDPGDGQRFAFYGELSDFSVNGSTSSSGENITWQIGAPGEYAAGVSHTYFNGLSLARLIVRNSAQSPNTIALSAHGLTTCSLDHITLQGGGVTAQLGGNAAGMFGNGLRLSHTNMTVFRNIAPGNCAIGVSFTEGSCIGNTFIGCDFEVNELHIKNRSSGLQGLQVIGGVMASCFWAVDSTVGQKNEITATQFGGILRARFKNSSAGHGTYGGFGFRLKTLHENWIGRDASGDAIAIPTVTGNGMWTRNVWGQDVEITFFIGATDSVVYVRDWFDTTSAGQTVQSSNWGSFKVVLRAGESVRWDSATAPTRAGRAWTWRPFE